jgi:hypothetical protein
MIRIGRRSLRMGTKPRLAHASLRFGGIGDAIIPGEDADTGRSQMLSFRTGTARALKEWWSPKISCSRTVFSTNASILRLPWRA